MATNLAKKLQDMTQIAVFSYRLQESNNPCDTYSYVTQIFHFNKFNEK